MTYNETGTKTKTFYEKGSRNFYFGFFFARRINTLLIELKLIFLLFIPDSNDSEMDRDPLDLGNAPYTNVTFYMPKSYGCTVCGCVFPRLGDLNRHLENCLSNEHRLQQQQQQQQQLQEQRRLDQYVTDRFPCFTCKKLYLNKGSLTRHRRSNCPGSNISVCGICDREFPTVEDMMLHREDHFRDKPTN